MATQVSLSQPDHQMPVGLPPPGGDPRNTSRARVKNVGRHALSALASHQACSTCGFVPPELRALAATIRYLPIDVAIAQREQAGMGPALAACLYVELNGITKRLPRVLATDGARLGPLNTRQPRSADFDALLPLVEGAASRLADAVQELDCAEWNRHCFLGPRRMLLPDLVRLPLHRHHARTELGEVCT